MLKRIAIITLKRSKILQDAIFFLPSIIFFILDNLIYMRITQFLVHRLEDEHLTIVALKIESSYIKGNLDD